MNNPSPIPWSTRDIIDALTLDKSFALHSETHSQRFFSRISTDSRTIGKDELFLALTGENFDGHDFIPGLLKKGIKGFLTSKNYHNALSREEKNAFFKEQACLFSVKDTLKGLGGLARYQRIRSKAKLVAITGSNGKTTTRKMTGSIFSMKYKTLTTKGNLNNEIGLPLTLLRLSHEHEWAVVEMGMNHLREISRLSKITMPDIGIITNITNAHLEGLGSLENVATAKAEIMDGMEENAALVLNRDIPSMDIVINRAKEKNIKTITFFTSNAGAVSDANISADNIITADNIKIHDNALNFDLLRNNIFQETINIDCPASFMTGNALAASAAAFRAGMTAKDIKKGLTQFIPVSGRMCIMKDVAGFNIIDDTYNANPGSVKAALDTIKNLDCRTDYRVAVLGDMLELGGISEKLHFDIGMAAAKSRVSMLYTHGKMADTIIKGALAGGISKRHTMSGTKQDIAEHILENTDKGALILVKGSRGMKMETIIHHLTEH